jgi:hypothetical protein
VLVVAILIHTTHLTTFVHAGMEFLGKHDSNAPPAESTLTYHAVFILFVLDDFIPNDTQALLRLSWLSQSETDLIRQRYMMG